MFRGRGSNYRNRGNNPNSRGGRGGRSEGAKSTQSRGLFADGIWHCNCTPRLPAEHFKVKKEGKNQGRWFYTCQQSEPRRCDFFLWDEDAKPREEAAVLSGRRTEPRRDDGQDGWNAGRGNEQPHQGPAGKGLFARKEQQSETRDDESTDSPTPSPSNNMNVSATNGTKRKAWDADLDEDDFGLFGEDEKDIAEAAETAIETPHKTQKMGIYATPATTAKRKLPWLEEPTTPATSKQTESYFDTPSKPPTSSNSTSLDGNQLHTPAVAPTPANPASPSPPARQKDALVDPADNNSSLTSEVLNALSSTKLPADTLANVRSILTRHDLRNQGVTKGRDISRLALKAKDAKINELQARIASLEAEREVERGLSRMRRRDGQG